MTKRLPTRAIAGPALVAALALLPLTAQATTAPIAHRPAATSATQLPLDPAANTDQALGEFGACLASEGKGAIVVLVDQSGSLRQTDPDKNRQTAGGYLLRRLASFADSKKVTLDLRMAGFAAAYKPVGDWTPLNGGAVPSLEASLGQISGNLVDYDTDYWNALEYARQDVQQRSQATGGGCKAIVWLTDGEFDIDVRDTEEAKSAYGNEKIFAPGVSLDSEENVSKVENVGRDDMCRAGGLADSVRSSDITLLGVALSPTDPAQPKPNFDFARSIVMGKSAAGNCGQIQQNLGSVFEVNSLEGLLSAFDAISTPGQKSQNTQTGICQDAVCTEEKLDFVLDDSLQTVHAMAYSPHENLDAYLIAPGGAEPMKLAAGTRSEATGPIEYAWLSTKSLEINLSAKEAKHWAGAWQLVFVDTSGSSSDGKVQVNLQLSSDALIEPVGIDALEVRSGGQPLELQLQAKDRPDGNALDLKELSGNVAIKVRAIDAGGTEHVLLESTDRAILDTPVTLDPAKMPLGPARLETLLQITTAPVKEGDREIPGTPLSPSLGAFKFDVMPPQNFPRVVDATIEFPLMEEELQTSGEIHFSGEGCAWIDHSKTVYQAAPREAGEVRLSTTAASPDTCARIDGDSKLSLTLEAQGHGKGAVNGVITVMLAPEDSPEDAQVVEVRFTAEMIKPLDKAVAAGVFAAALILGIGLPIAFLYLMKLLGARIPAGEISSAVVSIPLVGKGAPSLGVQSNLQINVPRNQRISTLIQKPATSVTLSGREIRTRMGASPFAQGWCELASDGLIVASNGDAAKLGGVGRAPLGLRGTWFASVAPQGQEAELLLITSSAEDAYFDELIADARANLLARLENAGWSEPPAAALGGGATGYNFGGNATAPAQRGGYQFGAGAAGMAGGPGMAGAPGAAGGFGANGGAGFGAGAGMGAGAPARPAGQGAPAPRAAAPAAAPAPGMAGAPGTPGAPGAAGSRAGSPAAPVGPAAPAGPAGPATARPAPGGWVPGQHAARPQPGAPGAGGPGGVPGQSGGWTPGQPPHLPPGRR
ncbi:MAG: hypothetical protein Q3999_00845 [Buchananella hordeovulneris]|nr:hypothetical protein [Buchananella hordeovulneris]